MHAFCMVLYMQATALNWPREVLCRQKATVIENFRWPSRGDEVYNRDLYLRISFCIGASSHFPFTKAL